MRYDRTRSVNASPEPVDRDRDAESELLRFDAQTPPLTHDLFRFPAKLHPPVARRLLETHTSPGDRLLDPFCGSGTVLVEATVAGRHSVGIDVDPFSVLLSNAKTTLADPNALRERGLMLLEAVDAIRRSDDEYRTRRFADLTHAEMHEELGNLALPAIPNLGHWFRRYVLVDLARLRHAIGAVRPTPPEREVLLTCFAAILRGASNADPVPVSALEVTGHMRRRDAAGRLIDPPALFARKLRAALEAVEALAGARAPETYCGALEGDATRLGRRIAGIFDVVITSPPYQAAVDYYRRHALEMYWTGLVSAHDERLRLLDRYLGRARVPRRHRLVGARGELPLAVRAVESDIRRHDPVRADAFAHYMVGMRRALNGIAQHIRPDGIVVLVVGDSDWTGGRLSTARLMKALAEPELVLGEQYFYRTRNRHMSFARQNGADIHTERVLVFRRRGRRS